MDDKEPIIEDTPDRSDEELSEAPGDNAMHHSDTRPELGLLQQAMLTFQKNSTNKLNEDGSDPKSNNENEDIEMQVI